MQRKWLCRLSLVLGGLALAGSATAALITFDDVGAQHGTVIGDQYASSYGLTISARNLGGGPDVAALFDTSKPGRTTEDADLDFGGLGFSNALILQENADGCGTGLCTTPDDEGSRPAGDLIFSFALSGITSFGFDLLDIEDVNAETAGSVVFCSGDAATCEDGSAGVIGAFDFFDFIARDGAIFGDNSANSIAAIDIVAEFGGTARTVVFRMGGSGAIDNVSFLLAPEPGAAAMLSCGLLGLAWIGRRQVAIEAPGSDDTAARS